MPRQKCVEDDVIEVVEKAVREGRTFKSRKDLVKKLMEHCNYEHEASAYRLIKKLEEKGLLRHVSGYGYVLVDRGHENIIMRTCALLLDLVRPVKPVNEILREGFARYYGEEIPGAVVLQLMERVLEHVITSSERLIEEVRKAVPILEDLEELVEKEDALLNKYWSLIKEKDEHYNTNLIKEIENVLELKPPADPALYANILLDRVIPSIVKNNDIKDSCYREVTKYSDDVRQNIIKFCDKVELLNRDAPIISSIIHIIRERHEINMKVRKLRENIERLYDKVVNSMEDFYLNAKISGRLTGWCEICRKGSVNDELKVFVKSFIKSKVEGLFRGVWATRITSY
jgi:hypothetical protein